MSWIDEKLAALAATKEDRVLILEEIKLKLTVKPDQDAALKILNSPEMFEILDLGPKAEETDVATEILGICASGLPIETLLQNSATLERILTHRDLRVKEVGVKEFTRIIRHAPDTVKEENLVVALIKCLESEYSGVGSPCIAILVALLPPFLDSSAVKSNLEHALRGSSTVRCRAFEVAIKLGRESPEALEKVEFILKETLNDADSNDVLIQMNVLELLSDLPIKEHGLVYLENKGVFEKLTKRIESIKNDPLAGLLIPGIMRFFGSVGVLHPSRIFDRYGKIISMLFECITGEDFSILPTALDTLGYLSRSRAGKKLMSSKFGEKMKNSLKELGVKIPNMPSDLKIRALNALECVFYADPDAPSDNQVTCITESWWLSLSREKNIAFVQRFAQNPFPDIKLAALGLLKAVCVHRWGQEYLIKTGGFLEFLLDRTQEADKDVHQQKYDVIKALSESTVFEASVLVRLKQYVSEGAFYVPGVTEVAIEGAS